MERLIHCNAHLSKLHLKPSPFLPRLGPVDASKSGISFASRTESRRVNSFSCCKLSEDPSHSHPSALVLTDNFSEKLSIISTSTVNLPNGSDPKSNLLNQISDTILCPKKVAMLAKRCGEDDPILRPDMKQAVISLSQILLSSVEWEATLAENSQVFSGLVQGR